MKLEKLLYTAHATATGGRDGRGKSSDGQIDVVLKPPKEMGGTGEGVNPEQLFAVGYAACFIGAMKAVGATEKIAVPPDVSIDSSVGIGPISHGYGIQVELKITVPGMDKAAAQALVDKAHQVCPYSNATRGNIDVTLIVV
ncbi:MAG: organic hydroperoxide resistance protein [Rudaea sp.]